MGITLYDKYINSVICDNPDRLLSKSDIRRIIKYTHFDIFNSDNCIKWTAYLCNKRRNKRYYINFGFRGSRVVLHRLLYENFIGPLEEGTYIKFLCKTRGCCNLKHMIKRRYNKSTTIKKPFINNKPAKSFRVVFD